MEETQNSDELCMFLASTAHDMKNSISVLSGTLERLLDAASPDSDRVYPQMAQMLYQTRRLNDNLMQLLALYKRVGKPEYPFDVQPLDIGQLVEQVVALERVLLESRSITLDLQYDPHLIWHFDEDLIVGVIAHAINNAVHYTRDRILLAVREVGGMLEIRIEDNGAGFPKALLETGDALGRGASGVNFLTNSAGLGLYFSREVAKMHRHCGRHGMVALENGGQLGGACFILTLP